MATREAPIGLKSENVFAAGQLGFSIIKTYPDLDDAQLEALGIDDDAYGEFVGSQQRKSALHMMGGHPDVIQNSMEEECELVSNGIYLGDVKGYKSPEAVALRQKPRDWRLLLQLDSDDDAGMMWGDAGRLYVWIRGSDLEARDFSKVWMFLQCY